MVANARFQDEASLPFPYLYYPPINLFKQYPITYLLQIV